MLFILLEDIQAYLLFLNISVNTRHRTANTSPAVAKITYTTVRATDTVTTSSIGIPSLGIPSGIYSNTVRNDMLILVKSI